MMQWTDSTIAANWGEIERLAGEIEQHGGLYTVELKPLGYYRPAPVRVPSAMLAAFRTGK